ncbi:MAG: hypothetical protein ACR2QE_03040 [Acidimicrobiales bacterium]
MILHIHLFKNAGTSIERVLRDNFGEGWKAFDKDELGASVTDDDVAAMRAAEPGMVALSTHQFTPPLGDSIPGGVYPLLALRSPLTRLRSVYEFDRKRGPVTPAAEIAGANEFPEYVDEMIRLNHPAVINAQVRQLSGAKRMRAEGKKVPPVEELMHQAWDFVSSLPYVGLVEAFDDARAAWQRDIQQFWPDFTFFAARENVTKAAVASMVEENKNLRKVLGNKRAMAFNMANAPEWKLYHRAASKHGASVLS